MEQARHCLHVPYFSGHDRDACVIRALAGRATGCEFGLLAASYHDTRQLHLAARAMQRYLAECPRGPLVSTFQTFLAQHP